MSVYTDDIADLFNQLVCKNLRQSRFIAHTSSYEKEKCRLKKKLFNTLFIYQKGPHKQSKYTVEPSSKCAVWQLYHRVSFGMRSHRLYDQAAQLDSIFQNLFQDGATNDDMTGQLQFLLLLASTSGHLSKPLIGALPSMPFMQGDVFLPDGPLQYGDTRKVLTSPFYTEYPSQIFSALNRPLQLEDMPDDVQKLIRIFDSKEPFHMSENNFFTASLNMRLGPNEVPSFMGAFSQEIAHTAPGDGTLKPEVPDLFDFGPVPMRPKKLYTQFGKAAETSEDEGFIDRSSTVCALTPDPSIFGDTISSRSPDPLDQAAQWLQDGGTERYTWETRGLSQAIELPYISEAGPHAVDLVMATNEHRQLQLHGTPEIATARPLVLSESQLIQDILNMRWGVPSNIFHYSQTFRQFHVRDDRTLKLAQLTPRVTLNYLKPHLMAGSHYRRLTSIVRGTRSFVTASMSTGNLQTGLICRGFAAGLDRLLEAQRACHLELADRTQGIGIITLANQVEGASAQINFLAHICKIHLEDDSSVSGRDASDQLSAVDDDYNPAHLPVGMELIGYLFRQAQDCVGGPMYSILIYLFKETCRPFFKMLEDWAFRGVFKDDYNEFMINVNEENLRVKDQRLWTNAYQLRCNSTTGKVVPFFTKSMTDDIFRCGKTLNLIKLIAPKHHLLYNIRDIFPSLDFTVDTDQIARTEAASRAYKATVRQMAWQKQSTLQQKKLREELARRDLIRRAKEAAANDIERLQSRMRAVRESSEVRKRALLENLKKEAEVALERRRAEEKKDDEEDRELARQLAKRENELKLYDEEIESNAREDLIAYYNTLTMDAAYREMRADWKVQRRILDEKRRDFLLMEESLWSQELREREEAMPFRVFDSPESRPPSSGSHMQPRISEFGSEEEINAPDVSSGASVDSASEDSDSRSSRKLWGPPQPVDIPEDRMSLNRRLSGLVEVLEESTPGENFTLLEDKYTLAQIHTSLLNEDFDSGTKSSDQSNNSALNKGSGSLSEQQGSTSALNKGSGSLSEQQGSTSAMNKGSGSLSEQQGSTSALNKGTGSLSEQQGNNSALDDIVQNNAPNTSDHQPCQKSSDGDPTSDRHLARFKQINQFGHGSDSSLVDYHPWGGGDTGGVDKFREKNRHGHSSDSTVGQLWAAGDNVRGAGSVTPGSLVGEVESGGRTVSSVSGESELSASTRRLKMGHSSDSTVQRLLYGAEFGRKKQTDAPIADSTDERPRIFANNLLEPFWFENDIFDEITNTELLRDPKRPRSKAEDQSSAPETTVVESIPLSVLIHKLINKPLRAQIVLVNESIVNHFMVDMEIEKEFEALRHCLFLEDGEFASSLLTPLFTKLSDPENIGDVVQANFLEATLSTALHCSMLGSSPAASRINLTTKYIPSFCDLVENVSFDFLAVNYDISWPANLVISDQSMVRYNRVFTFLVQIKYAVWSLTETYHKLRREGRRSPSSAQFPLHHLELCRHEMEHVVRVLEGYMCSQVTQVTWAELEEDLRTRITDLDALRRVHAEYLKRAVARCLLTPKMAPIMEVINGILVQVHRFRRCLSAHSWSDESGYAGLGSLREAHSRFQEHARFLYRMVSSQTALKRSTRQRHLDELQLRMDMNEYYQRLR